MNNSFLIFLLLAGLSLVASAQDSSVDNGGYFIRKAGAGVSLEKVVKKEFPNTSFTESRREMGEDGRIYVRLQQTKDGAPVLGGELVVQLDGRGQPQQLSGHPASSTSFASAPPLAVGINANKLAAPTTLPDDELEDIARNFLIEKHPFAAQWNVSDHGDSWTRTNPWASGPTTYRRCRVLEIKEPAGAAAEMVYVDLLTGKVVFNHPLHCDLQRRLHHTNTGTGNLIWNEGDAFPGTLNAEDNEMLTATQEVYSLYYRTFGRRSYNGIGGQLRTVTQAAISGCPNARAFNNIVLACSGVVGDDIVGHEWTHNYTNELNGLIFRFESGSIQEGFSDIFGEAVDLLNDRGRDDNDQFRRDSCFDGNYRWSIAEDATAIDTILRDLWSPECKTDPSVITSNNYDCADTNGQDIHTNSLIVSRTFAVLTDGDTTGVDTVPGIGLTKALHIFYHANANYVTRVTDFRALSAMLRQSARDLQGTNLTALTLVNTIAPLSNQFITDADLASLDAAIAATGLNQPPPCPVIPTLAQSPPSGCEEADVDNLAVLFHEDWEAGSVGWELTETPVNPNSWDAKPWRRTTTLPDERSGNAMFAPNAHAGNCQTDRDNGTVDLTGPIISLPLDQAGFRLRFNHYYAIEEGTDGAQLSISVNGEDFILIPDSAFLYNGYDGLLEPSTSNDNPLAGTEAFTGADDLSTTGTWGTSLVDLSAAGALPGDLIQIRWTLGHDGCDGWLGWYLDEVTVGYCGDAILPVEYLDLTATGDKDHIDLRWQTVREEHNAGFYVERSGGGDPFQTIHFLPGGNEVYLFVDEDVVAGVRYAYRLRQVDLDGTENLSVLVSAALAGARSLTVFPNPNPGTFTVLGSGAQATVHDLNGRKLMEIPLTNGRARVDGLKRGVYLLRNGEEVVRVVVR